MANGRLEEQQAVIKIQFKKDGAEHYSATVSWCLHQILGVGKWRVMTQIATYSFIFHTCSLHLHNSYPVSCFQNSLAPRTTPPQWSPTFGSPSPPSRPSTSLLGDQNREDVRWRTTMASYCMLRGWTGKTHRMLYSTAWLRDVGNKMRCHHSPEAWGVLQTFLEVHCDLHVDTRGVAASVRSSWWGP